MMIREDVTNFSIQIEEMVEKKKIPYMEAVLLYCEQHSLEVEVAAKLISSTIKAKLQIEAEDLHFLPKSNTSKLPL